MLAPAKPMTEARMDPTHIPLSMSIRPMG
jgi:hypothetical protein